MAGEVRQCAVCMLGGGLLVIAVVCVYVCGWRGRCSVLCLCWEGLLLKALAVVVPVVVGGRGGSVPVLSTLIT